jgi:hypothetical protein
MPQLQGDDTTRCSQLRSNCIQLLLVINVERTCKINERLYCMDFFPMKWQTKGYVLTPYDRVYANP